MSISCPDDQGEFFKEQGELTIGDFPVNMYITKLLDRKASQRAAPVGPGEGLCETHSKAAELICLTDGTPLCVDCILFGAHKNHEYEREEDFLARVRRQLARLGSQRDEVARSSWVGGDGGVGELRGQILRWRDSLFSKIAGVFEPLRRAIAEKEASLREVVREKLAELEDRVQNIEGRTRRLGEKSRLLGSKFSQAEAELSTGPRNLRSLVALVMEGGELPRLLADLRLELSGLESESTGLISQETERLSLRASLTRMVELVDASVGFAPRPARKANFPLREERLETRKRSSSRDKTGIFELPALRSPLETPIPGCKMMTESSIIVPRMGGSPVIARDINDSLSDDWIKDIDMQLSRPQKKTSELLRRPTGESSLVTRSKKQPSDSLSVKSLIKETTGVAPLTRQDFAGLSQSKVTYSQPSLVRGSSASNGTAKPFPDDSSPFSNARRFSVNAPGMADRSLDPPERSDGPIANFSGRQLSDGRLGPAILEISRMKQAKLALFDGNGLTDYGFEELLLKLASHPSLERISLRNNALSEQALDIIEQNAKRLKKVKHFILSENPQLRPSAKVKRTVAELKKKGVAVEI